MNELVLIENLKPAEVFVAGGLDTVIDLIEKEVRSHALDISTDAGRKHIASLAHKIARSKTALDKMGKDLVSGWKEQSKKVDLERARVWDRLEALQKEIRSPLTEWEDAEKARVARHEAGIARIEGAGHDTLANWQSLSVEAMSDRLREIEGGKTDWQEFANRAEHATKEASLAIKEAIRKREAYDAEQAELARLRQAEAERLQKEREQRIADEAAAKAKAEAEAAAKAEAERAEQQRLAILHDKEAAEQRAKRAEEEKKAAEEKAERDRLAALEKAKVEAEAAAKAERDRIAAEKAAEDAATAKREADKRHKARVNNEALQALIAAGLPETHARAAIEAVAKGLVPHVKIQY